MSMQFSGNEINVKRYAFNNVECLTIIFFKVVKSFCKNDFCYLSTFQISKAGKLIRKAEMLFKFVIWITFFYYRF